MAIDARPPGLNLSHPLADRLNRNLIRFISQSLASSEADLAKHFQLSDAEANSRVRTLIGAGLIMRAPDRTLSSNPLEIKQAASVFFEGALVHDPNPKIHQSRHTAPTEMNARIEGAIWSV